MINKERIEHIAKLARLGLTDEKVKKMQKEISAILDYFEKLKEVDVSDVEPTSHSMKVENVMREDESNKKKTEKDLIDMAPDQKDGFLKVKSIIEK